MHTAFLFSTYFFHLRDQRKAQLHSFCVAWCPWLTSGEASAATVRSYSCGNAPEAKCWRWQLASVSSRGWIRAEHLNRVNAHTFSNRIVFFRCSCHPMDSTRGTIQILVGLWYKNPTSDDYVLYLIYCFDCSPFLRPSFTRIRLQQAFIFHMSYHAKDT